MGNARRNRVFRSLAHPVRRALLDALREEDTLPVRSLSARFDISQPALSQHLAVLREAGLVEYRQEGRQHLYRLSTGALLQAAEWLHPYARFWRDRLSVLGEHLEGEPPHHRSPEGDDENGGEGGDDANEEEP